MQYEKTPPRLNKLFPELKGALYRRARLFLVIGVVIFYVLMSLFVMPKADAWTGSLPDQRNMFADDGWDLCEAIKAPNLSSTPVNPPYLNDFDCDHSSYIIIDQGIANQRVLLVAPTGKISLGTDGSGNYITGDVQFYRHTINLTDPYPQDDRVSNGIDPYTAGTKFYNADALVTAPNVRYLSNYTGQQISTDLNETDDDTTCDALDFGCWMSKAFKGVTDTFLGVGEAMLRGIAYLFAPESDELQAEFDDFTSFFDAKFGFLLFPFEFIINVFSAFGTGGGFCNSSTCNLAVPDFYGSTLNIDLLQWRLTAPSVFTVLVNVIRGLTVVTLIAAIHRKYLEVIKK